jgi:predicted Fe-S protein YdhL (DUF1289 family)
MATRRDRSVLSPCKAVCVINTETGYCMGCYRTIQEIGGWVTMTAERKLEILEEIKVRESADRG